MDRMHEGYSSGGAGSIKNGMLGTSRLSEDKRLKKILNEVMESHQRKYVKSFVKSSGSQSNYSMRNKRQTIKPVWRGPLDA